MKKNKSQNMLVAAGLISILVGLFLIMSSFTHFPVVQFFFRPVTLFLLGGFFLYHLLTTGKNSAFLFLSLIFLFSAVLFLLTDSGIFVATTRQLWPFIVMIPGLALIPTGFYKYRRFHPVFTVPAIMIFILGLFFFLFSFKIIKMPLSLFAIKWWPSLLIFGGIGLIILYFYNQKRLQNSKDSEMSTEFFEYEDEL